MEEICAFMRNNVREDLSSTMRGYNKVDFYKPGCESSPDTEYVGHLNLGLLSLECLLLKPSNLWSSIRVV